MTPRFIKILILLPICILALEIQRENQNEFIFTDKIRALSELPCENGILFMPENSSYFGGEKTPGIPFRTYIIALPNSSLPSVDVENFKTETLSGKPCDAAENPKSLKIGKPYLKDNLWRVKINVPLLYSNGNSWTLRKDFRVKINFSGSAGGYSVGKRTLSLVENKKAAAKFGTKQISSNARIALKTSMENIDWLLRIGIGTKDLSTTADGMYALSFDGLRTKMRSAGREDAIDGIRVSELRLFGASPDTLSEIIGEEIFPNAVEIPIIVKDKNADNLFNSGDSIIFFGYGTSLWKKSGSKSGMDYYFSHSPYSYYQYFYLGANGSGKRLSSSAKNINNAKNITWKKYARSEKELLLRDNYFGDGAIEENTGKEWFWAWGKPNEIVTVNSNEFQSSVLNLSHLDSKNDSILIGVSFFPRRSTSGSQQYSSFPLKQKMENIKFDLYFQNKKTQNVKDTILGGTGTFVFAETGAKTTNSYKLEISSSRQNDRFDGLSVAYNYDATKSSGNEWLFPGNASDEVKIPVPENMELIKTENSIPVEILEGTNGYANDIILSERDTKYFLHKKNSYKTPDSDFIEAIPNKINSVSEPLEIPSQTEYLILTSEILQSSAVKLKQFRESGAAPTTLKTAVVLVEDIYRHHGAQNSSPVAIRDYIRYAKNRCPELRYVLLAGSGSYDYRKIRANAKSNLIPPYEAEDMSTDDFFAILDPGEAVRFGNYELSLAVGRIPVSNTIDFENYIQKAKDYESVSAMDNGIWRNTIIFAADDALQGNTVDKIPDHTEQMERTIANINALAQEQDFAINWRKIPLLQYERDGNYKKPEAARDLRLRLNQGALFTFYYGHGSGVQWADEDLLNTSSLNNISNVGKYTILGSFSCSVARFDDAVTTTLSEVFVNTKSKGAIAAIGSLRESFSGFNENIAKEILSNSFKSNVLLGEAILKTKNAASSDHEYTQQRYNNEKYAFLGEPVLSLPMPKISLSIGNLDEIDTIGALQKLNISGSASMQTGKVHIQVLEGEKQKTLSQNTGGSSVYSTQIKIEGSPIYSEEVQIKNGKFSTEFITPRKLSVGDSSAQIRLWAYKPGAAEIGRILHSAKLSSETSSYADSIKDNTPPSIKIYPCMRSGIAAPYAENASVSLEIPACLDVVVEDSTGLDYREEADEGIAFEVYPAAYSWHPWPFSEQTGKRAVARMNFGASYDPGEYVFKVNAQDIMGNAAFRSLKISLNNEIQEGLADVFNAPNPMKKRGTTFYFKDLSGERQSNVTIKIFDQNGKLVKTINNAISGITTWDGKDSRGRLLANGLYHYIVQIKVSSLNESGGKKVFEKKQKLVISR